MKKSEKTAIGGSRASRNVEIFLFVLVVISSVLSVFDAALRLIDSLGAESCDADSDAE